MNKLLLTLPFAAILFGCGGGGGSSSGSSENGATSTDNSPNRKPTYSIDATNLEYAAIKMGEGDWEKLKLAPQNITINNPEDPVTFISVCDSTSSTNVTDYDVTTTKYYITSDQSVTFDYCRRDDELPSITVSFNNADISTVDFVVSDTTYISSNVSVGLTSKQLPRTIMAAGYRKDDGTAFFYKRTGLNLEDGDVINIDFTNTTYSSVADYTAAPENEEFDYALAYNENDDSGPLGLGISSNDLAGKHNIIIPTNKRVTNDFYVENWYFHEDSSYKRYVSTPDNNNELSTPPAKTNLDDLVYAQDEQSLTINHPASSMAGLDLAYIFLEFDSSDRNTNTNVYYNYYLDSNLGNSAEGIYVELVNTNDLPDFPLTLPQSKKDDLYYYNIDYRNTIENEYKAGDRVLSIYNL
ncbi:MAG: hypothetical protein P1U57_09935 [Oleibacter sp.]|nr:hypothetical protein [Thalassolituus sp.]